MSSRDIASTLIRRRLAFARRRILKIWLRSDLSHRWRGRVTLAGAEVDLWGNMVVAVSFASPSMAWMSLARPIMGAVVACVGSWDVARRWSPDGWDRESNRKRYMAITRDVDCVTLDLHSSRVCSGIGY